MRRFAVFSALLLLCLLLSGCQMTPTDITNLMRPPRLTTEQQALQQAFEKAVGQKYTMKFPLAGDNRSMYIMHDIDGDGQNEAMVLYCPANETGGTHVMVLKQFSGQWRRIADISGDGNDVENIDFGDYNGDGVDYLSIGWTVFTSTNFSVGIYKVTDTGYTRIFSSSFTAMRVLDINSDNKDDLLLLMLDPGAKISEARLIGMQDGHMRENASAPLDGAVNSYAGIYVTRLYDHSLGVLVDGYKGANAMVTELICWNKGRLTAPFYDTTKGAVTSTLRNVSLVCADIDGDGAVEIPFEVELPGYESKALKNKLWRVNWSVWDGKGGFTGKLSAAYNFAEDYYFIMPANWDGRVTVQNSGGGSDWVFREWDEKAAAMTRELFEIRVFTDEQWQKVSDRSGYTKAYEQDNKIYALKMGTPAGGDGLYLQRDAVLNNLRLTS